MRFRLEQEIANIRLENALCCQSSKLQEKDLLLLFVDHHFVIFQQFAVLIMFSQMATLLKQFGVATTDDVVPLIYAGLVDPLLAVRAQVAREFMKSFGPAFYSA